ncbi:MAG: TetR/AcrR family transcriptional regulator [Maritimibacter sp.]
MPTTRSRKSASDRKAEIVETAIRLSADVGPNRVTTQHLADAVGVTQPAIFRHFATKTDIWMTVGDRIIAEMAALVQPFSELHPSELHDHLHALVGRHFAHISTHPAIPAILFSRELLTEIEPLRGKVNALLDDRCKIIADILHRGQQAGLHKPELNATDCALLIMSSIQGLSMRWLVHDQSFDLPSEGQRVLGGLIDSFRA